MRVWSQRLRLLAVSVILIVATIISLPAQSAYAGQFQSRSLTLVANGANGGSAPGVAVNHRFTFSSPVGGGGSVGSIKFEYCTTASGTCTSAGLTTTSATIGSQTVGGSASSFTINNTTNGAPYITRTAAAIAANTQIIVQLNTITNPSTANTTFYVRIAYYTATNATGSPLDSGSVAASTADPVVLTGTMPESLIFCTGATVTTNCSTSTSASNIQYNDLFSPTSVKYALSEMAASTNAVSGYAITVNGNTMTSGSNTITANATAAASTPGTTQFGMNLMANTITTFPTATFPGGPYGVGVTPTTASPTYKGQPKTGYDTADSFKFVSGDTVAASDASGAGPSNSQKYTATYIVNVTGAQPAGQYTTTLTYICTATF